MGKTGPARRQKHPRSPGKDRCVIEANMKAPASILERAVGGHSSREMSAARPTVSGVYRPDFRAAQERLLLSSLVSLFFLEFSERNFF
jgi:hypothetical protein